MRKGEIQGIVVKVKEEIVRMKKAEDVDKDSEDYKKIIRMLGEDKMKKNWEQFAVNFDKVHSDFLVSPETLCLPAAQSQQQGNSPDHEHHH